MNTNVWNLSQIKTTFFIRERKQAQKKHLQKLKQIKSSIDMKNFTHTSTLFHPVGNCSRIIIDKQSQQKSPESVNNSVQHQNSIISSIIHRNKSPINMNTTYTDNLRVSSSLSRLRQARQIQRENTKLISRLIKAKPSISDTAFKKNHINHMKYKENILKNKYLNPDYTKQVKAQAKSFSHLLLKPIQNLIHFKEEGVSRIRTMANEIQPPKSENHRFNNLTSHQPLKKIFRQ